MDEPKHKMSTEHGRIVLNPFAVKKPKKRSIVERELETNLTARITSPVTGDGVSTSRYGRARRIKTAHDSDRKISIETLKSSQSENTPVKIPISKPVLNSPCKAETPKKALETSLDNINQDNKALSRFDDQLLARSSSSSTEHTKVYIRKDLIQNRDDEDDIILIKDLFSPPKSGTKPVRTDNQSTVKYSIQNGHISNTTVVKTLDFDGNKCRKGSKDVPKNELFNIEARCPYQVGDLAWARMGTFPFWPCIITRDPASEMFVRKKLFGRIEHDIIHVTFFADNGRHNWVVDNMLRKYSGPAELVNTREKFTAEDKKKDPRLYAAFFISEKKQTLWSNSVEEAEMIQREPKRLRIEIFNDLLQKARASKKQLRSGKVTRTDSDVSLSESLYDSLFSEDDSKSDESKTSRNRSKNPKIDVSDVVTACLDNMAAKTGNIKIQRQSHMDRWLQKAKSKTPEKVKTLVAVPKIETVTPNTDKDIMLKVEKLTPSDKSSNRNKRKRPSTKPPTPVTKVYSLRRSYEPQIPQNNVSENQLKVKNEQVAKNESKIESDFMDDTGPEHVDSSDCDVIISKDAPVVIDLINEEMNDSVADADKVPFESTKDKSTDYVVYAIDDLLEDKNRKDETFKSTEESDTVKVHILKNEIGEEQDSKTTDEDLITPTEETKTNVVPKSIGIYLEFKKKLERLNTDSPKSTNNNDKVVAEAINTLLDGKIKSNDQPLLISKTTIVGNVLSLSITEPCKDSVDKNNDLSVTSEKSFVETKVSNRTEENKDVRSEKNILEKSEERYYVDECKSSCNVQDAENSILINTVQENQVRRGSSVETMEISSVKDGAEYKMSNTAPVMEKQVSGSSPVTNEQNASIMEISSLTPQDSDNQAQISETNTDEKNGNKTVIDTVSKLSPRKGDAMVLIPGRSDDDSNLDSEFNVHTIDLQDHNSNLTNISIVKSKNEIKNTTEEENIDQGKSDIKSNENYHNMSIDKSLSDEDITMSEKCDISNESGNSESILELVNDISDILKDKYEEKEEICVSLNKTNELLESCCNELADSTNPIIEIKTVEKSCSIESNNFLEQVNTGPVVKDLLSDNKDTYFREVNISKPPDLISGSLTAKTDLLLDIQNDSEEDGSDEEPSPEYEPLGDEITEDFRQHLKCIESHVMDKKDDAQLVKVCDEIVYIEESKMKLADLKFNISPIKECSFDKNHFKAAKSPVKETIKADIEDENNQIESDKCKHVETEKSIKLNEDRNGEVKKEITIIEETDNIDLTKEVKAENLYLDPNKSNEANAEKSSVDQNKPNKLCDAYNILGSFKSPPVKKSLSLKKDKHRTPDPIDTKLIINDRYKTIDQIEEIISSKREPKRLPIENGEVNIPEIKENGYSDKHNDTPDLNDDDFDIDDVSVNSEDSEISLPNSKFLLKIEEEMPRRSLRPRARTDKKVGLENPEFLTYYELNVDNLMEEYPELSQDDLLLYCYQTFLYKENLKSDSKQTEEMQLTVQGIKQETPSRKKTKKPQPQPKNTLENLFREKYKNAKKIDFDSDKIEAGSSDSVEDNTPKSEVYSVNPVDSGIGKDREETPIAKRKTKSQLLQLFTGDVSKEIKTELINDSVQIEPIASSPKKCSKEIKTELIKEAVHIEITTSSPKTPKLIRTKTISPKDLQKSGKRIPVVVISPIKAERTVEFIGSDCDLPLRQLRSKVVHDNKFNELKKEIAEQSVKDEVETVSVCSDNEPLLTLKPKVNKIENTNDDPEFVKYLELKMDAIIDENPQLSYDEIQEYLHKVYIHENSSKTEIQKNEEIESSNLVKGLGQETQPTRKPRRKPKLEKLDDEEIISKEKPKRKTVQHYYNEAFISDFEDELEVFEIFKTKKSPITVVSKAEPSPKKETIETKAEDSDNSDESTEEIISTMDEIELYFKQLTSPKPNVFKGLAREKVCEICEDVSDLIKCKGCNGTFHYDCVNTVTKEVETPVNTDKRGRKKKKLGRKRKSQEPESDERHDISEDNISMDDIQSCTFDAANLEAQLEAKMKELLDKEKNINYDSYSSDDGIDWIETVAGKCEIVDVKLKLRTPPIDYANFKCKNCRKYSTPVCFVCKSAVSKTDVKIRQKCSVSHCHSYYHVQCLDHWPQTQFNAGEITRSKKANEQFEALTCPRHVCHTCVSDDPRGCKTRFCGDKLARCVRCPATYHTFNRCLPAGTQILTASLIICPRHYEHRPGKVPCHVNTGWCFICALGGSLICCEYCPTSFHPDCLNIKPPEGNYMCEDCETGRLPLYGEMVWVKLGHYRWWPGVVLHPSEIPDNIMAVTHGLGEFVVRFFGQYDHYWVNRGRVFPYQEGDSGRISGQKSKIDADFTTAMEHAQKAFEILKNSVPDEDEESDIAASLLPPHYIKLKCNKPIGSLCGRKIEDPSLSLTQCECDPNEIEPCGPNTQCLNRVLLTECGPTCRAAERCHNRAFEKRFYPKLAPYKAPHRGWGLKTLEDIKAGQFVIEYVGELIDQEEFQRRMRRKHEIRDENFYFLTLDKERMIDAGPKGNLARFMNHCCEPNCETQKWTVLGDIRVGLFAIDDIPANSEVTFNYNLECTGIEKKQCLCGAQRCSGYIGAKPKQDQSQRKKKGFQKRVYKKRKNIEESPSTSKNKVKKPVGRPPKPKELTEIEKDLFIIKNATTSSGESSRRHSLEDKTKIKTDSNSTEQSTASKETDAECKKELKINNANSESTISNNIDYENHIPRPVKIKIKLGNSPEENTSEVVSNFSETSKKKALKKKIDFNSLQQVSIPNGVISSEACKNNKALKRKIDCIPTKNVSISIEPSAKKQKCDKPMVGD